jgi:hypothetical protein
MMGICSFVSPECGKDDERNLELAALNYLTKTRDVLKAAFVSFALAESFVVKRMFKDANVALIRVANEVGVFLQYSTVLINYV